MVSLHCPLDDSRRGSETVEQRGGTCGRRDSLRGAITFGRDRRLAGGCQVSERVSEEPARAQPIRRQQ